MSDQATEAPDVSMDEKEAVEHLGQAHSAVLDELSNVIVGMETVIDEVMIALFAKGHCLLVGVPGLAKTLLVSTLAETMSLDFNRIQFTPDLMPSDITGTEVLNENPKTKQREFKFVKGPIFSNVLLADEINRTPPKTQAALLEAMQEKRVTAGGENWDLDRPFFVLATQNPIEQEGTYPLPEAQLDRFLFNIIVDYPSRNEEVEIAVKASSGSIESQELERVLTQDEILKLQQLVRRTPVADHISEYAVELVRATRPDESDAPDFIKDWVSYGAGPRASIYLLTAGKSRAMLRGRFNVSIEDIQAIAHPVLRHRMLLNFSARSEDLTTDDVVDKLLETIPCDERLYDEQQND